MMEVISRDAIFKGNGTEVPKSGMRLYFVHTFSATSFSAFVQNSGTLP